MTVELWWFLLVIFVLFLSILISPGFYALLHPWIRDNDPGNIYGKMYGLSFIANYIPFMAALSQKMDGFYRAWWLISLLWGLIYAGWIGTLFMINMDHGGFTCATTLIIWFGIFPLFIWESARYMNNRYKRQMRQSD